MFIFLSQYLTINNEFKYKLSLFKKVELIIT